MSNRRLPSHGLLAVLLALMAQLAIGASVPRSDPVAAIAGVDAICHTIDDSSGTPAAPAPMHPLDCPVCPFCIALHAPAVALVSPGPALTPPEAMVVLRGELPPPSTAPPAPHRPPGQPRAPPNYS